MFTICLSILMRESLLSSRLLLMETDGMFIRFENYVWASPSRFDTFFHRAMIYSAFDARRLPN